MPLHDSDNDSDDVIEIQEGHEDLVRDTKMFQLSPKLRKEYCCRIGTLQTWLKANYLDHYYKIVLPILPLGE